MTNEDNGNSWLKLTIESDPVLLDSISDFLVGIIEAGVESAAADEPDYGKTVAYLEQADLGRQEQEEIRTTLENHLAELSEIFNVSIPSLTMETIAREDWGKKWKTHFKPFAILPELIIVPSWEQYEPKQGEQILTMDPGMAFGTGHHATTALSLELLSQILKKEQGITVLDVGTGTGILGMAALLISAGEVLGIDNDPEAVGAARENAKINGLAGKMTITAQSPREIRDSYQVVVANIVHDVLLDLSTELSRLTSSGGHLILSGILCEGQLKNIINHFSHLDFSLEEEKCRGEWAAVHFRKIAV